MSAPRHAISDFEALSLVSTLKETGAHSADDCSNAKPLSVQIPSNDHVRT